MVCDETGEDPSCSDQFWVLPNFAHVSDHLHYLEVEYPKAYLNCLWGEEDGDGDEGSGRRSKRRDEMARRRAAAEAMETEWEEFAEALRNKVIRGPSSYQDMEFFESRRAPTIRMS